MTNPTPPPNLCPYCKSEVVLDRPISVVFWFYELPCPPKAATDLYCARCGRFLWFMWSRFEGGIVIRLLPGGTVSHLTPQRVDELMSTVAGHTRVVVNLSDLRFAHACLLGTLVKMRRSICRAGGKMRICNLQPEVRQIFRIVGLDRVFAIWNDEATAIARF